MDGRSPRTSSTRPNERFGASTSRELPAPTWTDGANSTRVRLARVVNVNVARRRPGRGGAPGSRDDGPRAIVQLHRAPAKVAPDRALADYPVSRPRSCSSRRNRPWNTRGGDRVNSVSPAGRGRGLLVGSSPATIARREDRRVAAPSNCSDASASREVAEVVLFLCSDNASVRDGARLRVEDGYRRWA